MREFHPRHDFEVLAAHRSIVRHRNFDFGDGIHVFQKRFHIAIRCVEGYIGARDAAEGEGKAPRVRLADDTYGLVLLALRFLYRRKAFVLNVLATVI